MNVEQRIVAALAEVWQQELRHTHCVAASDTDCDMAARRMVEALSQAGMVPVPKAWLAALAGAATAQTVRERAA